MSDLDRDDARPATPDVLVIAPDGNRRNRRRVLPIAALAATVAIAGGTYAATRGSDSAVDQARPAASVTQLVHGAASAAEQARTSRMEMTADMSFGGQSFQLTGSGRFDYRSSTGDFTMNLPSFGGQMRMVMVPGTFYMQMSGLFAQGMPPGKSWLRIDLDKLGQMSGVDIQGLMDQAKSQNPVENLRLLTEAGNIRKVGTEQVRGVPTTHYAGHIGIDDMEKYLKGMMSEQLDDLRTRLGNQPVSVDVWIDDHGLPRRMAEHFSVDGTMTMALQMDLFDFGTPVHVSPPPDSEVTDLGDLMSSGA